MRELALALAAAGFPVFPVRVHWDAARSRWRKDPLADWKTAATTDATRIKASWSYWASKLHAEEILPGLPLAQCGLVVVDADRHGGPDGVAALATFGPMPPHPIIATRSGGEHHYFRQPATLISKKSGWRPGIDLIGASGFVVAYAVPQGPIPELPEMFWLQPKTYLRCVDGLVERDPVLVADLVAALQQMDPVEWRGDHERWFELLMGAKYVGISLAEFTAWSTRDLHYADHADEIARWWRSVEPRHGGGLFAALREHGIAVQKLKPSEVRLQSKLAGGRLNGIRNRFARLANPSERDLFSWACLLAEVLRECGLGPLGKYRGLLEGAAMGTPLWSALGAEGVRRTIERAFAHVEAKGGAA
jgi:hypothetical protein